MRVGVIRTGGSTAYDESCWQWSSDKEAGETRPGADLDTEATHAAVVETAANRDLLSAAERDYLNQVDDGGKGQEHSRRVGEHGHCRSRPEHVSADRTDQNGGSPIGYPATREAPGRRS